MFKIVKDLATIGTKVYCELYATSKDELTSNAVPIGMPAGRELASGSYGVTWYGDCFIYDESEGFSVIGGNEDAADAADAAESAKSLSMSLTKSSEESEKELIEEKIEEPIEEKIEELEHIEEKKAVVKE